MSLTPERELELLRFLETLSAQLKPTHDVEKALRYSLRAAMDFFRATSGAVAVALPGCRAAEIRYAYPRDTAWDVDLLATFIRSEPARIPRDLLVSQLRRRGRAFAALAMTGRPESTDRRAVRSLHRIANIVSEAIERIELERMLEVRDRIDQKTMEELRPQDLFYQVLHGLRALTRYDHSSAILIREEGDGALTLVAEQIAWTKGKSRRIGANFVLDDAVTSIMATGAIYGFDRVGESWREWENRPVTHLAELLDYNRGGAGASGKEPREAGMELRGAGMELRGAGPAANVELREAAMLVAPLTGGDGVFGVLKIAACHPGTFGPYEAELVERFRSHAAIAIQNSRTTESLRARMVEAEKKHAMADLARGVSHDVNNALGSVLPLVQEMQEDVREGRIDPEVFAADLEQIQQSLEVCRRIFGGMLAFARGRARRTKRAQVREAIDSALTILKDGMRRRGISLDLDIPADLPGVAGGQTDLEQVFLNLFTNAREAMPRGGAITVRASAAKESVEIEITDTGPGIPADLLSKVQEPFFTTKPRGNGLGLSICRSILWEMNGSLNLESLPGAGARATVRVPRAPSASRGEGS